MDNREYLASADAAVPTRPVAPSAGFPRGGLTPTKPGPYWFHQMGEELRALLTGGGVAPDGAVLNQLAQAIRRMAGANITVVTAAMSPFALTADHAGLVLINAAAGNVVLTLPLANVVAGLPLSYDFERIDVAANAVTVNAAGANLIDGVASFTLVGQWASRSVRGDAVSAWATVAASAVAAIPPGQISFFAQSSAPSGFLKANGAAISRTVYALLFAAIGTTYGVGDGATTFNLPDLRGEFVRGWDDGRGIDAGRAAGSWQKGTLSWVDGNSAAIWSARGLSVTNAGLKTDGGIDVASSADYLNAQYSVIAASGAGAVGDIASYEASFGSTRPRNIALLACIKF